LLGDRRPEYYTALVER